MDDIENMEKEFVKALRETTRAESEMDAAIAHHRKRAIRSDVLSEKLRQAYREGR